MSASIKATRRPVPSSTTARFAAVAVVDIVDVGDTKAIVFGGASTLAYMRLARSPRSASAYAVDESVAGSKTRLRRAGSFGITPNTGAPADSATCLGVLTRRFK